MGCTLMREEQPVGYFGSKATTGLSQALVALMPPHSAYLETHLGGGALMKRCSESSC